MSFEVNFAFIREGSSDDGLIQHIRALLVKAGASSAIGDSRHYRGSPRNCLTEVLKEEQQVDLIFYHHDSDAPSFEFARSAIIDAARALGCEERVVPVVPVQELEAWLLTDEQAIRDAVGRSRGRAVLNLPKLKQIEQRASPKEVLAEACLVASETSGAKRRKEVRQFPVRRETLLNRLDRDGSVTQLPSWRRFVDDLESAVGRLRSTSETNKAEVNAALHAKEAEPEGDAPVS